MLRASHASCILCVIIEACYTYSVCTGPPSTEAATRRAPQLVADLSLYLHGAVGHSRPPHHASAQHLRLRRLELVGRERTRLIQICEALEIGDYVARPVDDGGEWRQRE